MGFEPSEPQMAVGSLMETALPAFEQVLFDKARPSVASITSDGVSTTNASSDNSDNRTDVSLNSIEVVAP